ncbi:MAG: Clp protease ClpP, partial [Methanosarcinaceae archaeon]|nr:Clp protease ClpP [Methanosarcinaceae archaeon]
ILAFDDQLENLTGNKLDIIIETPGGYAEVVEDLVKLIRDKFDDVAIIIPGSAKSAGTIFAMSGNEILMGATSALGPIDAQILSNGKKLSAGAFLQDLEKIKKESEKDGKMNPAYAPIMQQISLGEIQQCENAQNLSKTLVSDWLFKYFLNNEKNKQMSDEQKYKKASEIAKTLCDHSKWLTHSRSIKIGDLKEMGMEITNYNENPELDDAITRYYNLLRMSFDGPVYKICETKTSQIYRIMPPSQGQKIEKQDKIPKNAIIDFDCPNCKNKFKIQANFERGQVYEKGNLPYPVNDNMFTCPACRKKTNLLSIRKQIEQQTKRVIK